MSRGQRDREYRICATLSYMSIRATSYRLDPHVKQRLEQQAAAEGVSERALLERLVTEGLDMLHHPGITFRAGRTGRRAALAGGPDIWEIASAVRHTGGTDEEQVDALAEQFEIHPRHVRVAIDYAAAHRGVIDAEVAANDAAAEQARELAQQRADLMAS